MAAIPQASLVVHGTRSRMVLYTCSLIAMRIRCAMGLAGLLLFVQVTAGENQETITSMAGFQEGQFDLSPSDTAYVDSSGTLVLSSSDTRDGVALFRTPFSSIRSFICTFVFSATISMLPSTIAFVIVPKSSSLASEAAALQGARTTFSLELSCVEHAPVELPLPPPPPPTDALHMFVNSTDVIRMTYLALPLCSTQTIHVEYNSSMTIVATSSSDGVQYFKLNGTDLSASINAEDMQVGFIAGLRGTYNISGCNFTGNPSSSAFALLAASSADALGSANGGISQNENENQAITEPAEAEKREGVNAGELAALVLLAAGTFSLCVVAVLFVCRRRRRMKEARVSRSISDDGIAPAAPSVPCAPRPSTSSDSAPLRQTVDMMNSHEISVSAAASWLKPVTAR